MCGIAGYIGKDMIPEERVSRALSLMKNRGPDVQAFKYVAGGNSFDSFNSLFLHSRLSIIDLDPRSNQPFSFGPCTIVFNGEIYNYVELRSELERQGISFTTTSDTEVLLKTYLQYGLDFVNKLEGMWAFAIWDSRSSQLILSRDRFAEKPLYFYKNSDGIYFASETKTLKALADRKFRVNSKQVLRNLALGYKSLYKHPETYFEEVYEVPYASVMVVDSALNAKTMRYWTPSVNIKSMTLEEAVEGSRYHLFESVRLRLRSDVPLAFCLSGGVDSASLVSIAAKKFNSDLMTFSIIESDERYDERDNIMATINDVGCRHVLLTIPQHEGLSRLKKLVSYHDAPVATTTFYVHSLLSEKISENGYRVAFSGTAADELYTGYYDHFLLHLSEMKGRSDYPKYLNDWKANIAGFIRNPILSNPDLYTQTPDFREHVFDNSKEFSGWLTPEVAADFDSTFTEFRFNDSLLRNRMLNELFHEATPVILHEDDLNSMCYSVENRSPYLDSRLCDFMYSVPPEFLIRDGYGKYILRESVKGILNDKVRLDRRKKGFNASMNSLIDLKNPEVRQELLDPQNKIFQWLKREKILPLFDEDNLQNHYSKFLFNMINTHLFLEDNS